MVEYCETEAKVNPIWRDVRGAYVIDAEQHALINPISRSRVGIGRQIQCQYLFVYLNLDNQEQQNHANCCMCAGMQVSKHSALTSGFTETLVPTGTDALTVSRFFVSDSQQSQSSLEITERDIISLQTLLKPI